MVDVVLVVMAVGFVVGLATELAKRRRLQGQPGRSSEESLRTAPPQDASAATEGTLTDVSSSRITTDVVCAECGQPLRGMLSSDVLAIELDFQDAFRCELFCSQDHAAAWLAKPLPSLPPTDVGAGHGLAGWDWAVIALVAILLGIVGFALFGVYSLLRLIL